MGRLRSQTLWARGASSPPPRPRTLTRTSWSRIGISPGGLPIGKSIKAEVTQINGRPALVVEFMFDPDDEDAVRVAKKFASGFMKDVSVGFRSFKRTLRAMLPDGDHRKKERGYILAKNVLLELSPVTIGANPEAKVIKAAPDLLSALEARIRALEDAVTLSPAPSAKRDPLAELFGLEK
jgi:hypothetical protein